MGKQTELSQNGEVIVPETTEEKITKKGEQRQEGRGVTYTLKAFGDNIKRIANAGLLTTEEEETLTKIRNKVLLKYIETAF